MELVQYFRYDELEVCYVLYMKLIVALKLSAFLA